MSKNDQKLDQMLLDVGMREVLSGTDYVRRAVKIYAPGMSFTKEVYPAVARQVNSTPSRVERAMRHAIESAFDRAGYESGPRFFGNSINPATGKVTNGEFIARMAKLCREGFDI